MQTTDTKELTDGEVIVDRKNKLYAINWKARRRGIGLSQPLKIYVNTSFFYFLPSYKWAMNVQHFSWQIFYHAPWSKIFSHIFFFLTCCCNLVKKINVLSMTLLSSLNLDVCILSHWFLTFLLPFKLLGLDWTCHLSSWSGQPGRVYLPLWLLGTQPQTLVSEPVPKPVYPMECEEFRKAGHDGSSQMGRIWEEQKEYRAHLEHEM